MSNIFRFLALLVSIEHFTFLIIEMFFWQTPFVQKLFGVSPELAEKSGFMAANQGLYNGFIAAGLIWGIISCRKDVSVFFLSCVIIAGIFGAFTVKPTVFLAQSVPAIIALGVMVIRKDSKNKTENLHQ